MYCYYYGDKISEDTILEKRNEIRKKAAEYLVEFEEKRREEIAKKRKILEENGKRDGYGIFFYSNGAKYEGTWKDNNKDGFGIFTYNDGRKYIGLFKGDNFCGNEQNQMSESAILKYLNDYKSKLTKIDKPKKTKKKIGIRRKIEL